MRSLFSILLLVALATPLAGQDATTAAEIRAVVSGFHAALAAGDSSAALARLHPDVVIFEGGHAETLAQYRSGHVVGDMAFAGATNREVTKTSVTPWDGLALYTATSRTTGQYRGREIDSSGTETMVLVRSADGWLIRHIHWSSR